MNISILRNFEHIRTYTVRNFALIMLLFLMPFISVSCNQQPIITLSGLDLASGKSIEIKEPFTGKIKKVENHPEPLAIIAFAASAIGLVFTLAKGRASTIFSVGCGATGFLALLLLKVKVDADVLKQGQGVFSADYRFGFWVALLFFASILATNGYLLFKSAIESVETEDKKRKTTFLRWYAGGLVVMVIMLSVFGFNYTEYSGNRTPDQQAVSQQAQAKAKVSTVEQMMAKLQQVISPSASTGETSSVSTAIIDGNWQGTYESHGHPPTPFTMAINKPSNGGLFDGSASEQIASSGTTETIQSKLSGAINMMSVAFTKEFSFNGKQYSVQYIGTYDPIKKQIRGTWKGLTGNAHGSFMMWR